MSPRINDTLSSNFRWKSQIKELKYFFYFIFIKIKRIYSLNNKLTYKINWSFFILNESPEYRKFSHFKLFYTESSKIIHLHITNGIGAWVKTIAERSASHERSQMQEQSQHWQLANSMMMLTCKKTCNCLFTAWIPTKFPSNYPTHYINFHHEYKNYVQVVKSRLMKQIFPLSWHIHTYAFNMLRPWWKIKVSNNYAPRLNSHPFFIFIPVAIGIRISPSKFAFLTERRRFILNFIIEIFDHP